jgi:hypothetical protein
MALLAVVTTPRPVFGQEEEIRSKSPGFRTDFGFYLLGGIHTCVDGGNEFTACKGNGTWSPSGGVAGGVVVRPFRFFSIGLDLSFTNLSPMKNAGYEAYKRLSDLNVGSIVRLHIPIRIKLVTLEPAIGFGFGFVNGYVPRRSEATRSGSNSGVMETFVSQFEIPKEYPTKYRLFGPSVSGVLALNLFLMPGFGMGWEVRFIGTFYQQVCEDYESGPTYCRGYFQDNEDTEEETFPLKIFTGFHLIYYI